MSPFDYRWVFHYHRDGMNRGELRSHPRCDRCFHRRTETGNSSPPTEIQRRDSVVCGQARKPTGDAWKINPIFVGGAK